MSSTLFRLADVTLRSGQRSGFKIDCDALTDADWQTLAYLAARRLPAFGYVEGVPRGGLKFADALSRYADPASNVLLLAEDVVTTGGSLERWRGDREAIGIAVFGRGVPPDWVRVLFPLWLPEVQS